MSLFITNKENPNPNFGKHVDLKKKPGNEESII